MQKKVILITGASSGIGFDAAQRLAKQGHKVYSAARRLELMEPLKKDGVVPLMMNVTDEVSMVNGVQSVMNAEGRIDVLVNNAGYGYLGAVENVALEEARRQLEVNLFGMARLTQLVLPHMREQQSGRIINVSSIAGKAVLLFGGWYNVSKYAVEAFSDALRIETKSFGIKVSLIEPGGIKTNWGIIAADHLEASSRGSAYEEPALNMAETLRWAYNSNLLSTPQSIGKAITKAVNARCPKTRYRAGIGANSLLTLHAIMPTRWWDALVSSLGNRFRFIVKEAKPLRS